MGHSILSRPALPVADPTAPDIAALAADMVETMDGAHGIGLAAPQVAAGLRMVVFRVPGLDAPPRVLINPVIENLNDAKAEAFEACLSVPGLTGPVPRFTHIVYRAMGLDGRLIECEAQGLHARIVQHECDHLDGILYPARLDDFSRFGFSEEILRRYMDAPQSSQPGHALPQEQEP